MTLLKKTVTTAEVTTPGDRPGQWITKTTRTETIEESVPTSEWPLRFGLPIGMASEEQAVARLRDRSR